MSTQAMWALGGMAVLVVLGSAAPKIAGGVVILLVAVLAIELAQKKLI